MLLGCGNCLWGEWLWWMQMRIMPNDMKMEAYCREDSNVCLGWGARWSCMKVDGALQLSSALITCHKAALTAIKDHWTLPGLLYRGYSHHRRPMHGLGPWLDPPGKLSLRQQLFNSWLVSLWTSATAHMTYGTCRTTSLPGGLIETPWNLYGSLYPWVPLPGPYPYGWLLAPRFRARSFTSLGSNLAQLGAIFTKPRTWNEYRNSMHVEQ